MAVRLFELAGAHNERFSPYCWRVRFALAHKGIEPDIRAIAYHDIRSAGGGGHPSVPILQDGAAEICDSWAIARHLEDTYPQAPALFGPDATQMGAYKFIEAWTNQALHPAIMPMIVLDIHDRLQTADQAYFRETREKRFGRLEDARGDIAARQQALHAALAPVRSVLERQKWLGGTGPDYADYIVAGTLQWPRMISTERVVAEGDPVAVWLDRCLDLFDGLGRRMPAAA